MAWRSVDEWARGVEAARTARLGQVAKRIGEAKALEAAARGELNQTSGDPHPARRSRTKRQKAADAHGHSSTPASGLPAGRRLQGSRAGASATAYLRPCSPECVLLTGRWR